MLKKFALTACCSCLLVCSNAFAQNLSSSANVSYERCLDLAQGNNFKMTDCTLLEANRILKIVEEKYEQLSNNPELKNWNNGTGMFNGNFKNLYNEWVAYRDRYCSLYGTSMSPDTAQGNIADLNGAECLLELTKRQNKDMDVIAKNLEDF